MKRGEADLRGGSERIRAWRKENGYTYMQACRVLGIGYDVMVKLMRGSRMPSYYTALLCHLNADIPFYSWLFNPGMDRHIGAADKAAVMNLAYRTAGKRNWAQRRGWEAARRNWAIARDKFGWQKIDRPAWRRLTQPEYIIPVPPNCDEDDP